MKKSYTVELTQEEIELLICGCSAQIQEFCISNEERKPFEDLIVRLEGVLSNDT